MSDRASSDTAIHQQWAVRKAQPSDADRIRSYWDAYFGMGDASGTDLVDAVVGENEYSWGVVAVADHQIVGVGLAANYLGDAFKENIIPHESIHSLVAKDNGYLNFSAVAPTHRGQGIHKAMVKRRVELLQEEAPTDRVFALSWQRDGRVGSEATFRSLGWNDLAHVDEYYRRYGCREHCPDCPGECTCDAIIFGRDL